jgi:hypothetical protein
MYLISYAIALQNQKLIQLILIIMENSTKSDQNNNKYKNPLGL